MARSKRTFSLEFREEAVKMVIQGSRPIAQVCVNSGSTRGHWGTG